jgi:hypothetical protein
VVLCELQPPATDETGEVTETEETGPIRQMRLVYRRME